MSKALKVGSNFKDSGTIVALGIAAGLCTCTQAQAGNFYVSGDTSVVYALPGGPFGQMPNDNGVFFSNALGSGNTVRVYDPGLPGAGTQLLNSWYNSLPGVTSAAITGTFTPAVLSDVELLFITLPQRTFDASEISALQGYMNSGGSLFVIGEHSSYDFSGNVRANALLQSLGSTLRISNTFSDPNSPTTGWIASPSNGQVVNSPLTSSVNTFVYGGAAVSAVSGGQPVFLLQDMATPFIASETVPSPAALTAFGACGLLAATRRRR